MPNSLALVSIDKGKVRARAVALRKIPRRTVTVKTVKTVKTPASDCPLIHPMRHMRWLVVGGSGEQMHDMHGIHDWGIISTPGQNGRQLPKRPHTADRSLSLNSYTVVSRKPRGRRDLGPAAPVGQGLGQRHRPHPALPSVGRQPRSRPGRQDPGHGPDFGCLADRCARADQQCGLGVPGQGL